MDPESDFIRELNKTQPGQLTPAESEFYAILSRFDPAGASTAKEIPQQLLLALTNGLIDRLMKEANDLVVNTASMSAIDPSAGTFIKDRLDFGVNGVTYHTNYFLQPKTVEAVTRWLGLETPAQSKTRSTRKISERASVRKRSLEAGAFSATVRPLTTEELLAQARQRQ